MAALVGWRRVVLAFIVALIVGSVLGSLVQTQFNLQALEGLGLKSVWRPVCKLQFRIF